MPWAVLVRAANVGGRVFRPKELVAKLRGLEITSLGAAGTFAVGAGTSADEVRGKIARALPFPAEIMVVPAARWRAYVKAHLDDPAPSPMGARRYLTVAASPVEATRRVPLYFPDPAHWGVSVDHIDGPFVTGWYRRLEPRMLYPNAVIEKEFGVAATTRWWETVVALDEALGRRTRVPASPRSSAGTPRPAATTASPRARGRAGRRAG